MVDIYSMEYVRTEFAHAMKYRPPYKCNTFCKNKTLVPNQTYKRAKFAFYLQPTHARHRSWSSYKPPTIPYCPNQYTPPTGRALRAKPTLLASVRARSAHSCPQKAHSQAFKHERACADLRARYCYNILPNVAKQRRRCQRRR